MSQLDENIPQAGTSKQSMTDIDAKINNRLREYVKSFVTKFEEKKLQYEQEICVGGDPKKGKKTKSVSDIIGHVVKQVPVVNDLLKAVSDHTVGAVPAKNHRKKAKRIVGIFSQIEKLDLRDILVKAGGDIFRKYESQFSEVTDVGGSFERAMEKLADDAVGRAMNYLAENEVNDNNDVSINLITQAVVFGKPKTRISNTFLLVSGRKLVKLKKELKSTDLYENVGLVTIKIDGSADKYYCIATRNSRVNACGYRQLFEWEKLDSGKYRELAKSSPQSVYRYELNSKEQFNIALKGILNEINENDSTLQAETMSDTLTEVKEILVNYIEENKKSVESDMKPIWFNMRTSVTLFTGRKKQLEEIHKMLQLADIETKQKKRKPAMVAITGLGGVGKTTLARYYAENFFNDYDGNVICINSETRDNLKKSFVDLAKELKISTIEEGDHLIMKEKDLETISREVYEYFSRNNKKSLFIFDNVEEYDGVKDCLPQSLHPDVKYEKPYILITSRNRDWERGINGNIPQIDLTEFTKEEAKEFVKKFLVHNGVYNDDKHVVELTEKLYNFPLALTHAVAYIVQENKKCNRNNVDGLNRFGIENYLVLYKKDGCKFFKDGHSNNSDRYYTETVLITWIVTLNKIATMTDGQEAIDIISILAYFASDKIKVEELFSTNLWKAIELLNNFSMININNGVVGIHRLVQEVIRLGLKEELKIEETVLENALRKVGVSNTHNPKISEESVSHIASVWKYVSAYPKLIHKFYLESSTIPIYNYNDGSPLHLLASKGHAHAIKNILNTKQTNSSQKLIDSTDLYQRTALYTAAENGHKDVVQVLMENGANVNTKSTVAYKSFSAKTATGWTPLHVATFNGHLDIVKIIYDKDNETLQYRDSLDRTPADLAASCGRMDIVEYLMPDNISVCLVHAEFRVAKNCTRSVAVARLTKCLNNLEEKNQLRDIIDIKLGEWTLLHLASSNNWKEVAEILVRNGAKITDTKPSFTPLHCASSNDHLDMVKFLVEVHGAHPSHDVNEDGWTSLHGAAQNGSLNVVKYFIEERKINGNITDKKGSTPLQTAAFHGQLEVVRFLLKLKEVKIDVMDIFGATPIFSAALTNNRNVVEFLMENGAEAVITNGEKIVGRLKISLLHIAAAYDDVELIKRLVSKGADKDIGKDISLTPLHVAAFFGSSEVIRYLIQEHADSRACIKISSIQEVLKTEIDTIIKEYGYSEMFNKIMKGIFTKISSLLPNITPLLLCEVFNPSHQILFGEVKTTKLGYVLKFAYANIQVLRKHIDVLHAYVQQRKSGNLNSNLKYLSIDDLNSNLNYLSIDELIVNGGDVSINDRDIDGNTALHRAVKKGNKDFVEYLINENADLTIVNNNGDTPFKLAKKVLAKDPKNVNFLTIVSLVKGPRKLINGKLCLGIIITMCIAFPAILYEIL